MLSKRLKELRLEAGLTQKELANAINTSQQNIGLYENGKRNPKREILNRISKYFNVSINYLLGNSEIRNPEKEIELDFEKVKESLRKSLGYNGADNIPEEELESMAQAFIEHFGQ